MQGRFLRDIATRCLIAARQCFECEAKETFIAIAEELTRKANEVDGLNLPPPFTRQARMPPPLAKKEAN